MYKQNLQVLMYKLFKKVTFQWHVHIFTKTVKTGISYDFKMQERNIIIDIVKVFRSTSHSGKWPDHCS